MNNLKEMIGGFCGTIMSAVGTAIQSNEVLQTISLVITILGGIISMIVIPILNWWRQAKKDGKITNDEIVEGLDTLKEGLQNVNEIIDKKGEDNE